MSTMLPPLAMSFTFSTTLCALVESRPDVGSSRKRREGLWMMSMPIDTLRRSPPETPRVPSSPISGVDADRALEAALGDPAGEGVEEGGLAGAAGAEDRRDLAAEGLAGDVVEQPLSGEAGHLHASAAATTAGVRGVQEALQALLPLRRRPAGWRILGCRCRSRTGGGGGGGSRGWLCPVGCCSSSGPRCLAGSLCPVSCCLVGASPGGRLAGGPLGAVAVGGGWLTGPGHLTALLLLLACIAPLL